MPVSGGASMPVSEWGLYVCILFLAWAASVVLSANHYMPWSLGLEGGILAQCNALYAMVDGPAGEVTRSPLSAKIYMPRQ